MITGKTKLAPEEKEMLREKKQRIKDKFEANHLGEMFEHLYPLPPGEENKTRQEKYDALLAKSREIWEDSMGLGLLKKKDQSDPIGRLVAKEITSHLKEKEVKPLSSTFEKKVTSEIVKQDMAKAGKIK